VDAVDEASRNVVAFLEGVQAARQGLRAVWNHYTRQGLRSSSHALRFGPAWALAGCLDFGITVTGADGRDYGLSARLRWSGGEWVVQADASLEQEGEDGDLGYPVLRKLPEYRAADWPAALAHLRAVIAALVGFDDLIPAQRRPA
jgi:hypothetical protein